MNKIKKLDHKIILNQFNCLSTNYVIELGQNDRLNTIIKKYYQKWKNENYEEAFNKYFTNCYFEFSVCIFLS